MGAAEMAINYVLLTDNGKAGDGNEYKYCIDRLGEVEFGEKNTGNSICVLCKESPAVVNIISVACRQPLLVGPICLLLLLLKAFAVLSNTKTPFSKTNSLLESHTGIFIY